MDWFASLASTLSEVHFIAPTLSVYIAILLVVLLLCVSGFASSSEIAFFSLSPSDLNELDPDHSACDNRIEQLRGDSERTLATILITNNLVNVTIIMLTNYVFANIVDFGMAAWLQFLCVTVLLTFVLLLFGEIIPKVYARQNTLRYCRWASGGIMFARRLFWPLENVLMSSGSLAEKVMHKENRILSVDDLEQALELTDKSEIKEEQSMLQGIIRFGDETAKAVLTPSQDTITNENTSTFNERHSATVDRN